MRDLGLLVRELKFKKLTQKQEDQFSEMLFRCTGLYNLVIRRIKLDAQDGIYHTKYELYNQFVGHSRKSGIHSRMIQAVVEQAFNAWDRCFKKTSKEPKLKSVRNKLNSLPFPDPIKLSSLTDKTIRLPLVGVLRYFKQEMPEGKIKRARVVKRASGWYVQLTIDTKHVFEVKETEEKVGIDTGFKHLAVLSDGTKVENQRNYIQSQERLGQAQRGKRKKLVSRLHERIRNQRRDYSHKVSRKIVEKFKEIYITKDNLRGQSRIFGKSVMDAGIAQLRSFIIYKGDVHGRKVELVDSKYTTMTCSACGARDGPTGLSGLAVRNWECGCGANHDRDINSARVILNSGLGINLVPEMV